MIGTEQSFTLVNGTNGRLLTHQQHAGPCVSLFHRCHYSRFCLESGLFMFASVLVCTWFHNIMVLTEYSCHYLKYIQGTN